MTSKTYIILILLLLPLAYGLDGKLPAISIYNPQDNATITRQTQDFIYSVEAPLDAKTCTLSINGEDSRSYSNVPRKKSIRFTTSLPSDTYTWQITCTLNDNTVLTTPERTLQVDIRQTSCLEKISKGSGSYRYVFTLGCLKKSPVVLSELRVNDWIEFKLTESERVPGGFESRDNYVTFYINKISKLNNEDYIQMYSNSQAEKINIFIGGSAVFDTIRNELNFTLDSISQKKAKYTVRLEGYDYMAAQYNDTVEDLGGEEPVDTTTQPSTIPEDTQEEIDTTDTTGPTSNYEDVPEDKTKTVITVIIIFILAIIVLYLMLTKNKGEKEQPKHRKEQKNGKKAAKTSKKSTGKATLEKKEETKQAIKEPETHHVEIAPVKAQEQKPKKKRDLDKEKPAFIIEGPK